VSICGRVI